MSQQQPVRLHPVEEKPKEEPNSKPCAGCRAKDREIARLKKSLDAWLDEGVVMAMAEIEEVRRKLGKAVCRDADFYERRAVTVRRPVGFAGKTTRASSAAKR